MQGSPKHEMKNVRKGRSTEIFYERLELLKNGRHFESFIHSKGSGIFVI